MQIPFGRETIKNKQMKCAFLFLFAIAVGFSLTHAQSKGPEEEEIERGIQKGNDLYKRKQYQEAGMAYGEAEKGSFHVTARYNRALALYKQGKKEEAIKAFEDLAFKTEDRSFKSKAYYNAGAIYSGQQKLEESIEAYKNALRQDPDDKQARENLQKALLALKKKTPKKENKKNQQQQKKPEPRMNQKESEQRLKLLEQKEKEIQQRMQKEKSKTGGGQPKDW